MKALRLTAAISLTMHLIGLSKAAIVIHLPGYAAAPFANALPYGDDLAVDGAGRLYAPSSTGITRFSNVGIPSDWSSAGRGSLAIAPDGSAYLATRSIGNSILRLGADGSFTPLVPSSSILGWTWVALSPSGSLFANVWAGAGVGLYSIDTTTGAYTPIVSGGPGLAGAGFYGDMVYGSDDRLYATGYDGSVFGLFRLDGSHFTRVAVLPHGGAGLTVDPSGVFYTAVTYGAGFNEVWRVDIAAGTTDLLASGLGSPAGIAFDAASGRLFVRDQDSPFQITAITVPEPSTCVLFIATGLLVAVTRKWRARSAA